MKKAVSLILLLLPHVLMLSFDRAVWHSTWNLLEGICLTAIYIDVPIAVCLLHWFRPQAFLGKRVLLLLGSLSLVSWATAALGTLAACLTGHMPQNGFSIFCAFALGWLYIWFFMAPIGMLYLMTRGIAVLYFTIRQSRHR